MTRHVLAAAREWAAADVGEVEVRFEGGTVEQMASLLGLDVTARRPGQGNYPLQAGCVRPVSHQTGLQAMVFCRPQGEGDLGERMHRACEQAAAEGAVHIVAVGADCPEITAVLLHEAYQRLETADLVLGPATDGGYYLIGLRRPRRSLFVDMAWGGEQVLDETLRRADQLGLVTCLLPVHSDVDRPDDLPVWYRARDTKVTHQATRLISIVIPTLNEAEELPRTLSTMTDCRDVEIIVVDAGSVDATTHIAADAGCRVLESSPPRARQLNVGAAAATGQHLLFLHADTRLPAGFTDAIHAVLSESGVIAGAFRLCIDAPGLSLRLLERSVNLRSRFLQLPYGDQGLFVGRGVFEHIGGFPELPIMDDFAFVRRLRRYGRIRVAPLSARTSARRWKKLGPWRTTWINQKVIVGYQLGIPPERLLKWYKADAQDGDNG